VDSYNIRLVTIKYKVEDYLY